MDKYPQEGNVDVKKSLSPESYLMEEIDRLHSLLSQVDVSLAHHADKLQPVVAESQSGEALKQDMKEQPFNPLWDTKAGQGLRELGFRLENLSNRISALTRETRL